MKKLFFLFSLVFLVLNISGCGQVSDTEEKKAVKVLRDFYTQYLTQRSIIPSNSKERENNSKEIERILMTYCTVNLRKQLDDDEIDYDLLVDGQYSRKEWLKKMVISSDKTKKNVYTVIFEDQIDGKSEKKEIKIEVINKGDTVLIDKILL
jgi:hypothetical protein